MPTMALLKFALMFTPTISTKVTSATSATAGKVEYAPVETRWWKPSSLNGAPSNWAGIGMPSCLAIRSLK